MAEASELFDLAAKISVDTRESDKRLDQTEKKVKDLTAELKKLDKQASSVGKSSSAGTDPLAKLKTEWASSVSQLKTELGQLDTATKQSSSGIGAWAGEAVAAVGPAAALIGVIGGVTLANLALHKAMLQVSLDTAKQAADLSSLARKHQTTTAMIQAAQVVAAQSGRDLNDVLKTSQGEVSLMADRLQGLNVIMGDQTVDAGKKLNSELVILTAQWEALEVKLGSPVIPETTRVVESLSTALTQNESAVNALAGAVGILAEYFAGNLVEAIHQAQVGIALMTTELLPLIALISKLQSLMSGPPSALGMTTIHSNDAKDAFNRGFFDNPSGPGKGVDYSGLKGLIKTSGGGGGGGAARVDAGEQLLKQLTRELNDLMPKRVMWERLMGEEYKKTADSIKKKIYVTDIEIDQQKRINALTRERLATGIQEREDFQKFVDLVQQSLTRRRSAFDLTGMAFADLGGGSVYGTDGSTRSRRTADGATRPRIATVDEQVRREQFAELNRKIHDLASDLTFTISDSLHAGFENGIMAGVQSFELGILRMIESSALKSLEEKLFGLLSGLGSGGSSGGGWLSKLLGIGLSAVGAAAGGGSAGIKGGLSGGFAGKFATGGFIPPGQWGIAGDAGPEPVFGGKTGATVVPHSRGGVTINVYAKDAQSFMSRDTQAQLARQMVRFQQKQALAG